MPNDLAKLNRLRVNAGHDELKSWKAPQHKLEEKIAQLEAQGYLDTVVGAQVDVAPKTDDPAVAAARPDDAPTEEVKGDRHDEAEKLKDSAVPPSLADSAMSKNVGKTEAKPEKETTKGKASLARGLDSDTMAVQSRARVRDHREKEKKDRKANKVQLSEEEKAAIKDEAKSRAKGAVDPKKDPDKAKRQQEKIKAKQDKRAAEGKTAKPKTKNDNEVTVAEIARELDIDPKVARAKLRRHEDKLTKLHTKGQDRWTFPKTAGAEIKKILTGKK